MRAITTVWFMTLILLVIPMPTLASDTCEMQMEITDPLFAVKADNGVPVQFSDIGCTVAMYEVMCAMEQLGFDNSAKVKDYRSKAETTMAEAFFVVGAGVSTPLGSDIVAFALKADADGFLAEMGKGRIMSYSELLEAHISFSR